MALERSLHANEANVEAAKSYHEHAGRSGFIWPQWSFAVRLFQQDLLP